MTNFKLLIFYLLICLFAYLLISPLPVWAKCAYVCCDPDNCIGLHPEESLPYICIPDKLCCETCGTPEEGGIINPVIDILGRQPGEVTIGYLVAVFIRLAYMFGSLMVLIFFIWGAIEWMTAGGSPESVQKAQARMTNAFIGLILLAGTYLVAVILGRILNINLLEIVLPKPIK